MYSSALYQILLLVLILAVIVLIFVLIRLYLILTDINNMSNKMREIVDTVYGTVQSVRSSIIEYETMIKAFIASVTTFKGIQELINKYKTNKEKE